MDPAIFHGALPFVMDSPSVARGGRGMLDSFRARLLCSSNWEADARTLGFEIDNRLTGYSSLWVKSLEPAAEAEDVVTVDVSGEGLSTAGDRRQRKIKCGARETSVGPNEKVVIVWSSDEQALDPATGEPIDKAPRRVPKLDSDGEPELKDITTGSGTMKRWTISEASVSVSDSYFSTTKPVMNVVGKVFSVPNPPAVPDYQWAGYGEPLRGVHPNGWVLTDRDVEEVFYYSDTIGLWRVTDTAEFRHPAFPD